MKLTPEMEQALWISSRLNQLRMETTDKELQVEISIVLTEVRQLIGVMQRRELSVEPASNRAFGLQRVFKWLFG